MRLWKNLAAAAAVASMAVMPVIAQAGTASSLSLRASTKAKKTSRISQTLLIGVIATVTIVGGAVLITESGGGPDSP